jgi:hypothetical protein
MIEEEGVGVPVRHIAPYCRIRQLACLDLSIDKVDIRRCSVVNTGLSFTTVTCIYIPYTLNRISRAR